MIRTRRPRLPACAAHIMPAAPAPITTTSNASKDCPTHLRQSRTISTPLGQSETPRCPAARIVAMVGVPFDGETRLMTDTDRFEADLVWPLWNGEDFAATFADEAGASDLVLSDVAAPALFGYRPAWPNGQAVIVMAGGGYTQLVIGKEGVDVARWLASLGFVAFVLAHRFPNATTSPQAPVDDAFEALRLIRARSAELGIDKVGVVGLSSGGHLAACLIARYPTAWTQPSSPNASHAARPDFLVVGYGPISTNAKGRTIIPDKPPLPPVEKQALYDAAQPDAQMIAEPPPTFIVYAGNDPIVPVRNAVRLYDALQERGALAELHIFADAPHGFALREPDLPVGAWPRLCEAWLTQIGVRIT